MKTPISAIAIILGWATAALGAAAPAPLTTLKAIHAVTNAEAKLAPPVAFEATVTYFPGYANLLFVQDGSEAIFVLAPSDAKLIPGDRVLVQGTLRPSFHPIVISSSVTVLRHGELPKPVPASFDELIRSQYDCMRVTVRAVVHTADVRGNTVIPEIYLQMVTDGGYIDAAVDSSDTSRLSSLLDAEVEITGIAGGNFDGKMQETGILIHVSNMADVKILHSAGASPQSVPVTPMDEILSGYHVRDQTQRVRVHGTITYYQPGLAAVLQDGAKSLWITTLSRGSIQVGDLADATGFPDSNNTALVLTHGEVVDTGVKSPIAPQPATWRQLAFWSANQPDGHLYDLVSIEGQVVTEVRGGAQDEYVLVSDGQLFSAIYRHPDPNGGIELPPMKQVPQGSRVRVTGICMNEYTNRFNTEGELPFNILLRSFDDVTVVVKPSLLNIRNLILLVCALLLIVFAAIGRSWALERKMRRQSAAIASIEQRRGRILEDINGSRPLAEIVEQIVELLSFQLEGAPCWCQITDGARLGNCPPDLTALRVVQQEIPARSGPPLGTVFAAFDQVQKPFAGESEALSMAAGLATLAIETRKLYSDLLHRSEFDLLTDIHNRFSLETRLDAQIEIARDTAGIFGLIYIDLDGFKQVNDVFGHHIGDLYLQDAAFRMKQQLRTQDLLARLGGDEFAVLLPVVRNRADVEEIALRLERCFGEPFFAGGNRIDGSASVGIALYPEDSAARDGLLGVADAAMYVAKNARKEAVSGKPPREESAPAVESRA